MSPLAEASEPELVELLRRTGHVVDASEPLELAVARFQRERGLNPSGLFDPATRQRLAESAWSLGDRLLYLTRPYLRGDDVAALQDTLGVLGFDTGRVDGIFGPLTEHALSDFQRNCGLHPTGELTSATLAEVRRLAPRQPNRKNVSEVRELAELHREPVSALIGLWGSSPLRHLLHERLTPQFPVVLLEGDAHDAARDANQQGVGLVLALHEHPGLDHVGLYFYESYRFRSVTGSHVAEVVRRHFSSPTAMVTGGLSVAILRETTSVALDVRHGTLDDELREGLSDALLCAIGEVIHRP